MYDSEYTYTKDISLSKYTMHEVPSGVLLLYTANKGVYTARSYSTTQREFLADPLLQPNDVAFQPLAPLLDCEFQVDKTIK